MKILSFLGEIILVIAFIIALFRYGPVMLLAPFAIIFILFLLLCGVKLKQLRGKYIDFKILFRGEKYIDFEILFRGEKLPGTNFCLVKKATTSQDIPGNIFQVYNYTLYYINMNCKQTVNNG